MNENPNFIVGVKILDKEGMLKPIYKRTYREFMMIRLPKNDVAEEYKEALLLRRITFQTAVCNARSPLQKTALKSTAL